MTPAGRERFLQSLLSAKGARRRPRERSSAGASGGLLPAGSGKADAVWSSTRQTATTSHNFILESRPAAAPVWADGQGRRTGESTFRPGCWGPRGSPGLPSRLGTALLPDRCGRALPRAPPPFFPSQSPACPSSGVRLSGFQQTTAFFFRHRIPRFRGRAVSPCQYQYDDSRTGAQPHLHSGGRPGNPHPVLPPRPAAPTDPPGEGALNPSKRPARPGS